MRKVTKIVLTGGPCAGKTTAKAWIEEAFTKMGYSVLFVGETATELIQGGVTSSFCSDVVSFEVAITSVQRAKEKAYEHAADESCKKTLIICDRGVLDAKAYMSQEEFDELMKILNTSEIQERDSYDAVFHLVTAADGAAESYTLDNNTARWETPEQAIEKDKLVINAWTGHPHLRVIDNSTSFEDKMRRLVAEIASFVGEPVPLEIEKKYLIRLPDIKKLESLPNCDKVSIVQTYLVPTEPDSERRIRQRGKNGYYIYTLTEKLRVSSATRIEKEKRLTKDEYIDLLLEADTTARPIRKDRYCLTENNHYFEIDIYPQWKRHAIMELELRELDEQITFPPYIEVIKEITDNEKFSNYFLAHNDIIE